MVEALQEATALVVELEQLGGHPDGLAFLQLAKIGDVQLGGEGRPVDPLQPVEVEAHAGKRVIERLVEDQDVVGDVHVAIDVDPFGPDAEPVMDKGGRYRRIALARHAATLVDRTARASQPAGRGKPAGATGPGTVPLTAREGAA